MIIFFIQILSTIGKELSAAESQSMPLYDLLKARVKESMNRLRDQPLLPTKAGRWVSMQDQPLIADDPTMEKIFKKKDKVYFLDLGEKLPLASPPHNLGPRLVKGWWQREYISNILFCFLLFMYYYFAMY